MPLVTLLFFALCPEIFSQAIVFTSPDDAVKFAAQNSQVYLLQQQSALLAMKAAKYGLQDFLPSFSFSLAENDSTMLLAPDSRSRTIQLAISQEIFDGGKKKLFFDVNRLSSLYAYQDYEANQQSFYSNIILAYYQFLLQRESIAIQEELIAAAFDQLRIIEREVELGITLETDYMERNLQ